ncbi:ZrgA family zinc uptake protein [Endozoicomonadaceae bacterium StTr2]
MNRLLTAAVVIIFASTGLQAESVLHRAIDPSRINLDINLSASQLDIFYEIAPQSVPLLSEQKSAEALIKRLNNAQPLIKPTPAAECTETVLHLLPAPNNAITGYQSLTCNHPEKLKSIQLELHQALPGLHEVDVWLITDKWQTRQLVQPEQQTLTIRTEHF